MKHPKSISLGLICLFMCSTPAKAWHEAGHMVTALIAYEQLDPAVRGQLLNLLKHHPRFDEDFKADLPAGLKLSREALAGGRVRQTLDALVACSNAAG